MDRSTLLFGGLYIIPTNVFFGLVVSSIKCYSMMSSILTARSSRSLN